MKILFAADMSLSWAEQTNFDKEAVNAGMAEARSVFDKADFSMLNLECIYGDANAYTPIVKSGPNLMTTEEAVNFIDALKPTAIGLANNHTGDYGDEPMYSTMDILKNKGYMLCGAGENIEKAYEPVVFEKDGIAVSVIAVCENEFGCASTKKAGSAGYDYYRLSDKIAAEKAKGRLVVVYFHGGNETYSLPSPGKTKLYRHFIDLGAEAVIAMHTHCPQGYEMYKGKPVVYSMGNFFFPKPEGAMKETWFLGYMSMVDITENGISLETVPYTFDSNSITLLKGEQLAKFTKYMEKLNFFLDDEDKIMQYFEGWCCIDGRKYARNVRFLAEWDKDSSDKVCHLKNIFGCEAHNELITTYTKLCYDNRTSEAEMLVPEIQALQNPGILN